MIHILESVNDEYGVMRYLPKSAREYITEITMNPDYDNRKGRTVYRYYVTFTDGETISDIGIQGIKAAVTKYIATHF